MCQQSFLEGGDVGHDDVRRALGQELIHCHLVHLQLAVHPTDYLDLGLPGPERVLRVVNAQIR